MEWYIYLCCASASYCVNNFLMTESISKPSCDCTFVSFVFFFFVSSLFSLVSRAIWFWILFLRKTIKSRAKCKHTQKKTLSYRIWINGTRVKHDKTNRVNLVKCINANVLCPSKVSSLAPSAWFHSFESCINKHTVKNEWIIRSN